MDLLLSEGSQFIILFDDELALELGAEIYGSVADVFVNADGFKKSIPGPGVGKLSDGRKSYGTYSLYSWCGISPKSIIYASTRNKYTK